MNKDSSVIYDKNERKSKSNMKVVLCVVVFLLVFLVPFIFIFAIFAGVKRVGGTVYNEVVEEIVEFKDKATQEYSIESVNGYYDSKLDAYYVEGYFKNNSDYDFEDVSIEYLVYDEGGILLGEAIAYVSNLKVGNTWKFKATYIDVDSNEVVKYELSDVYVY